MNDAENLSKLLGHLPPAVFREFMVDEFDLAMSDLDAKKPKKEQREQMEAVLSVLGVGERQRIEEVAERIVLLSDGAGQDCGFNETPHSHSQHSDLQVFTQRVTVIGHADGVGLEHSNPLDLFDGLRDQALVCRRGGAIL